MKSTHVTVTRTRRAITTQLQDYCEANGLAYECITKDQGQGPQLALTIDGEDLTPGEAADKYLPGGFAGSYGQA